MKARSGLRGRGSQLLAPSEEMHRHTFSESPCPDSKFKKAFMIVGKSFSLSVDLSLKTDGLGVPEVQPDRMAVSL